MSQTIHARTSYVAAEMMFGYRFADMFSEGPDGRTVIDYRRFNDVEPYRPPG